MSRVFAYMRVSTEAQTTENQLRDITAAGFAVEERRAIAECVSGSVPAKQRAGFAKLLERLEAGDILVVTKLDRLGRNALDVRATVDYLAAQGIRVHCLALGGCDLTSAAGRMVMQVIAAMAEFELDLLSERTNSGIARARSAGKKFGRPPALNESKKQLVRERLSAGATVSQLAREFCTSRQTILRA